MSETAKRLIEQFGTMKSRRATWDSHWQSISDYVLPNREFNTTRTPGAESRQRIYNNTPGEALERLVGGVNSLLTNQALKWFDFGVKGVSPNDKSARWISETRDIVLEVLNSSMVNLYASLDECYESMAAFGTGIIFADLENGLRFRSIPLGACYIEEDYMGVVNTLFREFDMTLRQTIEAFGEDALPEKMRSDLRRAKDPTAMLGEKHRLLHCVGPRTNYDVYSPFATDMPYYSIVLLLDKKHVLKESGFQRMPFFVPRWRKGSGESYGRSPGMVLLQDIRYLNAMSKAALNSAAKAADPPVQMPDNTFLKPARLQPGGLNFYRSTQQGRIEPIQTGARPDAANYMISEIEARIKAGFYNDMFQMPQIDRMTATEVIQRQQDMRQLFSPTLNRLYSELLNPIVFEGFSYALRQNMISPPPEQLRGREVDINYVSPLARAQRASEVGSYQEWFGTISPMAEVDPTIMDNVHPDRTAARIAQAVSLPESMRRTDEELQELRRLRTERADQENQVAQSVQAASAAKDGAQAINSLRG